MAAPPQPQPGPPAAPAPPPLSAAPGPGQGAGPGPPLPAQVAAAQAQDFDPVQRFRLLIPQLKESLQTLMKVAAQNLVQNSNIDNGQKSADGALQRFDKSLEEFYALCDQLELCLRLAHECLSQSFDSAKHAPALVPAAPKGEGAAGESLPYTQYLPLIKAQIAGAKDIHNAGGVPEDSWGVFVNGVTACRGCHLIGVGIGCMLRRLPIRQGGDHPYTVTHPWGQSRVCWGAVSRIRAKSPISLGGSPAYNR